MVQVTYEISYLSFSTRLGIGESDGHVFFVINLCIDRGGVSTLEILTKCEGSLPVSLSLYSRT